MKTSIIPMIFIAILLIFSFSHSKITDKEAAVIKEFNELSIQFKDLYKEKNLSYSLVFKNMSEGLISFCQYNKKTNTIQVVINKAEMTSLKKRLHIKNILFHELESCSKNYSKEDISLNEIDTSELFDT